MNIKYFTTSFTKIQQLRLLVIMSLLSIGVLQAQTDMGFNYQGVARDVDNNILANETIGLRISIIRGSESGPIQYVEEHRVITDQLGQFALTIGRGSNRFGDLAEVEWASAEHFIQIEADFEGSERYTRLGVTPLLYVPLAAYALSSGSGGGEDGDSDPQNELQTLTYQDGTLTISDGNSVTIPTGGGGISQESDPVYGASPAADIDQADIDRWDIDNDEANELQTLSLNGNTLSISEGNSVTLPAGGSGGDADADPTNELQTLSYSNGNLSISDGNTISIPTGGTDADSDPTNELQNWNTLPGIPADIADGDDVGITQERDPLFQSSAASSITSSDISRWNNSAGGSSDRDNDPRNEIQRASFETLEGAGISNTDIIQLKLDGVQAVNFPAIQWEEVYRFSLGNDIRISHVETPFGFRVKNTLTANSIESNEVITDLVETPHFYAGEAGGKALHIVEDGIHFDSPDNPRELGWSFQKDRISYHRDLPTGNFDRLVNIDKRRLTFYNETQFRAADFGVGNNGNGFIRVNGTSGNANFIAGTSQSNRNHGSIAVYDAAGNAEAGIYVNSSGEGVVWGDRKQFRMDHPMNSDKEIVYISMEGPEAGAYSRGTNTLENGEVFVRFPEHYEMVIESNPYTVLLTPLSAQSEGLAVTKKTTEGFYVKELHNGEGNYSFDWEVKAARAGHEDHQVIQDKIKTPE